MSIIMDGHPLSVSIPPTLSGNFLGSSTGEATSVEDLVLGSLQHPLVRLRRGLPLKVRRSQGKIRWTWNEGAVSAEAPSFALAIERFRLAAVSKFFELRDRGALTETFLGAMIEGRI